MSEPPVDASREEGAGPLRPRNPRRVFYSIGEVCEMVGLKPHVLRYWETQFEELAPAKNRAGNRVYRARDVETISLIHRLVHEERYTIEGARRRLQELSEEGALESSKVEAIETSFLRSLRGELERVHALLDPPAR
ncbi:MerR family transcriptional regulator [soil metagenome]